MATPNAGVFDTVLNTFRSQIDSGIGTLTGPVQTSLGALIVISVAGMAIFWAIDEQNSIFGPLFRKILLVGFWSYMILNWQTLALAAFSLFGKLGIAAGGGGGGLSDFLNNPSLVVKNGLTNAKALWDFGNYTLGATNTNWGSPPASNPLDVEAAARKLFMALEILVSCVVMIVAYAWLALEIVVTVIEFHIVILITFIVLPFGVLAQTTSLAERSIGYVFSAGFKVMALGIVIAIGTNTLNQYLLVETPANAPTTETLMILPMVVVLILMLALHAPKYAAAVVSGATTTGAGNFLGAAVGVGAGIASAASGVLSAGKAAEGVGRAGQSAGRGSVDAARSASSAASSTTSGVPAPPRDEPPSGSATGRDYRSGAAFPAPGQALSHASAMGSASTGGENIKGSRFEDASRPPSPADAPASNPASSLTAVMLNTGRPGRREAVPVQEADRVVAAASNASGMSRSDNALPSQSQTTEAARDAEIDAVSSAVTQAADEISHGSTSGREGSPDAGTLQGRSIRRAFGQPGRAERDLGQSQPGRSEAATSPQEAPPPPPEQSKE